MIGKRIWLGMALVLGLLSACAPEQRFHGYAPDDLQLSEIQVGRDTRDTVAEKVGRPGLSGVMEGSSWYYVQSDWVHHGWRPPVEVRREVVSISFDAQDRVSNIERFGLQDGEVITLSRRVTDTGPSSMSALRQIFSRLGQFNPAQALGGNRRR
jgi:outer membrane protein assembly factor BamE (lipoprotein component of BamABCDE complex)